MLSRIGVFCVFSIGAAAVPNSVTIKDTSNSAQNNRPFTLSRVFAQGEIAHFAQAVIGGTAVATQCDIKTRWPDGSVDNFSGVAAGQIVTIQQGKGVVRKQPYSLSRP